MMICRKYVRKGELFLRCKKKDGKGKTVNVIDLEPLAMTEPKGKRTMNPLKRKSESNTPIGEKLMTDAMRGTRTSKRLARLQAHTTEWTSGGTMGKVTAMPQEVDKEEQGEGAFVPYWNVNKSG